MFQINESLSEESICLRLERRAAALLFGHGDVVFDLNIQTRFEFKVVDSCRTCSTKCSDTFRSFFVCGKEQESRKKICHHRAKKIHLPKGV